MLTPNFSSQPALARCVLRLDPRNRHVADGIGTGDLNQRLVATMKLRQDFTLLVFRELP
jgi:hypothetical protein